jgi:hypothetical protein
MRHFRPWIAAIVSVLALGAAPAAAGPAAADFLVFIAAGTAVDQVIPNGGTAEVRSLNFKAGAIVDNDGGEEATARIRFTLPEGLRFGTDAPDASESCTGTASTADCQTLLTVGTDPSRRSVGWIWDIVADRVGSYVLRAEIIQTSVFDPDLSSNMASATVVVSEASGGGSGGGGGGATAVSATAVKLTPSKPKAGAVVVATVRVTAGGAPVKPSAIACSGTIGSAKLKGTAKAASGSATCVYRTPKAAKGKTLRGAVSFAARGTKFTKRFSAKLG